MQSGDLGTSLSNKSTNQRTKQFEIGEHSLLCYLHTLHSLDMTQYVFLLLLNFCVFKNNTSLIYNYFDNWTLTQLRNNIQYNFKNINKSLSPLHCPPFMYRNFLHPPTFLIFSRTHSLRTSLNSRKHITTLLIATGSSF